MNEKFELKHLISLAKEFCIKETQYRNKELYGVTDGKAVLQENFNENI